MNLYEKAHLTLKSCNNLNFFNQIEIENCQSVWEPIQKKLEENNDETISEIKKLEEKVRESVVYLSLMFGKGFLLKDLD